MSIAFIKFEPHGSDYAWVDEQSAILTTGEASIHVEGHTQLDGAVIGSETDGALDFETGTFSSTDIFDNDETHNNSVTVSVGADSVTAEGELANSDREQTNFATVAGGDVIITDQDEQTALQDGTSPDAQDGVNYDETAVNTDLDNPQVIIKDEVNSATIYAESNVVWEELSYSEDETVVVDGSRRAKMCVGIGCMNNYNTPVKIIYYGEVGYMCVDCARKLLAADPNCVTQDSIFDIICNLEESFSMAIDRDDHYLVKEIDQMKKGRKPVIFESTPVPSLIISFLSENCGFKLLTISWLPGKNEKQCIDYFYLFPENNYDLAIELMGLHQKSWNWTMKRHEDPNCPPREKKEVEADERRISEILGYNF